MELNKLTVVYFSPTHTSRKIAQAVADGWGIARREEKDLTTDMQEGDIEVKEAICIVTVPVYGGLIAPVAAQRLRRLKGQHSIAIPIVVYGNRDYEDALVQLRDLLRQQGFTPLCGAAFIGEHSYSRPGMPIAEGRPDADDLNMATTFGKESYQMLCRQLTLGTPPDPHTRDFALNYEGSLNELIIPAHMKGNVPYKTLNRPTPQAPVVGDACYGCGECLDWCPTGAIFLTSDRSDTHIDLCTKCCACVKFCPVQARTFDTPYTAMLHQNFSKRREPECFLG